MHFFFFFCVYFFFSITVRSPCCRAILFSNRSYFVVPPYIAAIYKPMLERNHFGHIESGMRSSLDVCPVTGNTLKVYNRFPMSYTVLTTVILYLMCYYNVIRHSHGGSHPSRVIAPTHATNEGYSVVDSGRLGESCDYIVFVTGTCDAHTPWERRPVAVEI